MSRPSKFTQKLADEICERIAGGKSLKAICEDKGMPTAKTVRQWRGKDDEFSALYAHAREDQAEHFADEIVEIADIETDSSKARNRIDARKWAASKLAPKKYGDKLQHTGDGGGPVETRDLTALEFARRVAFALAQGVNDDAA